MKRPYFISVPRSQTIVVCALWAVSVSVSGCALHGKRHTIDFSPLLKADRLVVQTRAAETIKTITDRVLIKSAAELAARLGLQLIGK